MPAPPIDMPGGSGINHQDTIQKLLELERKPLQRLDRENQLNELRIRAWEEVRGRVVKLHNQSRLIYSFAGPFALRQVISSQPGAITGEASEDVEDGASQNIEVVQLATQHQIHSDPVSLDRELPAAEFSVEVNGKSETLSFEGGRISRLERLFKNHAGELVEVTAVNTDGKNQLLTLRSTVSGKRGEIRFGDPSGLLASIGLVGAGGQAAAAEQTQQTEDAARPEAQPEPETGVEPLKIGALQQFLLEGQAGAASAATGASAAETAGALYSVAPDGASAEVRGGAAGYKPELPEGVTRITFHARALEREAPAAEGATPAANEQGAPGPKEQSEAKSAQSGDASQAAQAGGIESTAPQAAKAEPERVVRGPQISVRVGDVELDGPNIARTRVLPQTQDAGDAAQPGEQQPQPENQKPDAEQKPEDAASAGPQRIVAGVVYREGGALKRKETADQLEDGGESELSLDLAGIDPASIETVYFGTEGANGAAAFSDLQAAYEREGEPKSPESEAGAPEAEAPPADGMAKNVSTPARDAVMKINGVEVTRPENQDLTDILQGVSLDLNQVTTGPVEVRVEANNEEIVNHIKEWVTAYNELMDFCRQNSKTGDPIMQSNPDSEQSAEDLQGLFATDSTVRQLMASLRMLVNSPYPSATDPSYRVLADIGITTGEPGARWSEIKHGLLQIEMDRLEAALSRNPGAVKELFASDANEDNVPDNGVAVEMQKLLDPYQRRAGGLITARIDLLKNDIRDNKDQVAKKEAQIERMEQDLRERFGNMERAVRESQAAGRAMQRNLPRGGGG